MNEIEKTVRKIKNLSLVAIIYAAIMPIIILSTVDAVLEKDRLYMITLCYQTAIRIYIMVQVNSAASLFGHAEVFPHAVKIYIKRIAFACMISGIGSSVMNTIWDSMQANSLQLHIYLTSIGVGCLLFVGAYIYEYGCEMEDDYNLTV